MIPQVLFLKFFLKSIYIPRALNMATHIWQGDPFYSAGLHRIYVLATVNTGVIVRGFGKKSGEWTGRVEISQVVDWAQHNN